MSNYDYYDEDYDFEYDYSDLKSHKRSDKVKWIITAIAFVLVFVLIGGIFAILLRSKNVERVPEDPVQVQTHWLSFEDDGLRISFSEQEQVWEDDGIVFTNSKGSGTKVGDYYNPVRAYAHSMIVVESEKMAEIIFFCVGSTYARNLVDSIGEQSGITATINDNEVKVVFEKAVNRFEVANLVGQVQLTHIAVTVATPTQSDKDETPVEEKDATPEAVSYMRTVAPLSADDIAVIAAEGETVDTRKKPSDDVLRAEVETFLGYNDAFINGASRVSYDDPFFVNAVVTNNINGTTMTLEEAGCIPITGNFGAFRDVIYAVLVPLWNPFEELYYDYGVESVWITGGGMSAPNMSAIGAYALPHYKCLGMRSYGFTVMDEPVAYTLVADIIERDTIPLPEDPVKEGYNFVGWYYGTQSEHGNGTSCKAYNGEPIYANTSLHAHFEIKKFTVTYASEGGSTVSPKSVEWNTAAPTPACERVGHNFLGWYLSDGTKYEGQPITENTVLKAHWQLQRFTVTFYVEGEEYKSMEVDYGTTFADLAESASNLGLRVRSIASSSGEPIGEFVSGDISVNADTMGDMDKALNTVKNNTWAIVGGVVGGVVLIAAIGAIVGALRRKRVR